MIESHQGPENVEPNKYRLPTHMSTDHEQHTKLTDLIFIGHQGNRPAEVLCQTATNISIMLCSLFFR